MKLEERSFNIYLGERPRVLLLGNGFNRAFGGKSWDCLLDSIKEKDINKYAKQYDMPMPLKASLLTHNNLAVKMREIVKETPNTKNGYCWTDFTTINDDLAEQLKKLIINNYDYVLTTNYSYEIEMALSDKKTLPRNSIEKMMNFYEIKNAQTRYLINTFNLVADIPIWHVHGEARKPDSMIIGHSYYGRLLRYCIDRLDKASEFVKNNKYQRPQKIGSWIDAFVLGNVDIIGYGLDFSEADIWWLIDYKETSKALGHKECGNTTFYSPIETPDYNSAIVDKFECRNLLLNNCYKVKTETFNISIKSNDDYKPFYKKAISTICGQQ